MGSIICRKCRNGVYEWAEDSKPDFENRKMICPECGFTDTIKEMVDGIRQADKRYQVIYGNSCTCEIETYDDYDIAYKRYKELVDSIDSAMIRSWRVTYVKFEDTKSYQTMIHRTKESMMYTGVY